MANNMRTTKSMGNKQPSVTTYREDKQPSFSTYRDDAICNNCKYGALARRYLESQNLPDKMFIPRYDYCFCSSCHIGRGDKKVYPRGNPPKDYVLPLGWYRFGLQVNHIPKGFSTDEIFKTWHMAFHGTHVDTLVSIWKIGFEIPGGRTAEGAIIKPWKGHFNYTYGPKYFDYEQIFVTPSPTYAGKAAYSHQHQFYDSETQQSYDCQVALQVRIKPGSYEIGKETIGESNIDPHVRDEEMEWSTKDRNAIMTTGLLIRMQ